MYGFSLGILDTLPKRIRDANLESALPDINNRKFFIRDPTKQAFVDFT